MRDGAVFVVATAVVGLLVGRTAPASGQTAEPATDAAPATTVAPLGPGTPHLVEPLPAAAPPSPASAPPLPAAAPPSPAGAPPPGTYTAHRRYSPGLATAGVATFLPSYMLAVFVGLLSAAVDGGIDGPPCNCNSQIVLWAIPVAGPMLGNAFAPNGNSVAMWPLAIWSGVEAAGLTMWLVGSMYEDVQLPVPAPWHPPVTVVPTVTRQLSALSLNFNW